MSGVSVRNTHTQAAGLLIQALEWVVFVAATINESLIVSPSAAAVTEASGTIRIEDDIRLGFDVAATKRAHNITSWRDEEGSGGDSAVTSAAFEDKGALANVVQGAGGADQLTDVVPTLLLAVARENLIAVKGVASIVVALDLVGNHLVNLPGNIDRDDRSSRGVDHRDGASGVGHIGIDSIMLLEDDGGEGLARNLHEEDREEDKESEGLVAGANLSAWKAESSVFEGSVW